MILVIVILIVLILIYVCVRKPHEKKQQDDKGLTQSIQSIRNQLEKDLANYETINPTERKMVDCELTKSIELSLKKDKAIEEIKLAGREAEEEFRQMASKDVSRKSEKP